MARKRASARGAAGTEVEVAARRGLAAIVDRLIPSAGRLPGEMWSRRHRRMGQLLGVAAALLLGSEIAQLDSRGMPVLGLLVVSILAAAGLTSLSRRSRALIIVAGFGVAASGITEVFG